MMYRKFAVMLFISFCIMYAVMFLNVTDVSHIYLSLTRVYMSLLMVTPMAIVMIIMMGKMYANKRRNGLIVGSNIVVFILAFYCLRTQAFISDAQYMQAMIPHHSSAVLTSKHANIKNAKVRRLSEEIIKSQVREIHLMDSLLQVGVDGGN